MQDWSYGFKVVYCFDKFTKPVQTYRDEIAVYKFMAKMLDEVSMVWLAYAQAENDGGESLTEENNTSKSLTRAQRHPTTDSAQNIKNAQTDESA